MARIASNLYVLVGIVIIGTSVTAAAKPFDAVAAEKVVLISQLLSQPIENRRLTDSAAEEFIVMATANSTDQRLCAALALAFAKNGTGAQALETLRKDPSPIVTGAAEYAIAIRAVAGPPSVLAARLAEMVRQNANPYTQMFAANRLVVDFPAVADDPILDAAKTAQNAALKADLLYYLSKTKSPRIARAAADLSVSQETSLPEGLAFVLGSITPGRSKDQLDNSSLALVNALRKNAQAAEQK